jgi:hypothetical protein
LPDPTYSAIKVREPGVAPAARFVDARPLGQVAADAAYQRLKHDEWLLKKTRNHSEPFPEPQFWCGPSRDAISILMNDNHYNAIA